MKIKTKITYLAVFITMMILKFIVSQFDVNYLQWFMQPIVKTVSFLTELNFSFIENHGYYNEAHNILINKSCSGTNFYLISLTTFICILIYFEKFNYSKLPTVILLTYLCTFIANASRIYISIISTINPYYNFNEQESFHHLEGTFIYLFFLIFFSLTFYLLSKNTLKIKILPSTSKIIS